MSWLGELYSVCMYKTGATRCTGRAVAVVYTTGGAWRLCRHHALHGALSAEERASLRWAPEL